MRLAVAAAMSAAALEGHLRDGITLRVSFRDLRAIVVEFAAEGGRRDVATAVLDRLRSELGDQEPLLDLLDVVCGFCEPTLRIWSDDAYRRRQESGEQRRS